MLRHVRNGAPTSMWTTALPQAPEIEKPIGADRRAGADQDKVHSNDETLRDVHPV
jgi:hypothetical protein